jgi:hypothetical protein
MEGEPYDPSQVRKLLREIISAGGVSFPKHACDEMMKDGLFEEDVLNVLRAGWVECPAGWIKGAYRYRVRTHNICVVVLFRSAVEALVVTAWRFKR